MIIVTGASRGIGKTICERLISNKVEVIGIARNIKDLSFEAIKCDVSSYEEIKNVVTKIKKKNKKILGLINAAGIASMNHALLTTMDTVYKIYGTNVFGTFLFCREAAKIMQRNQYGRIVNFSTVAVPLKLEGEAIYASSKAAVVSLTQILSRELANIGITVNAIGPTPVKTDLIRSVPIEKIKRLLERQAIHRYGEYGDIVNVIDFFIKPESDFITGQVIYLGGV